MLNRFIASKKQTNQKIISKLVVHVRDLGLECLLSIGLVPSGQLLNIFL